MIIIKIKKKLIKILNGKLNTNGLLIFEQIKNNKDLFDNLSKLSIKYKVIFLLPVRFGGNKLLNKLSFRNLFFQYLLKMIYKFLGKRINHFILIYKF